jgi:hypothetical protein
MWRRAGFIPLAILLLADAPPPANEVIDPGLWRVVVDLGVDTVNGQPPSTPHVEHEEETGCFSSGGRNIAELFADQALPEGCRAYQVHAAQGEIGFTAICPPDEDGVSMDMTGAGTYTSSRISMRIDMRAESDGNQVSMSGKLMATRLGNCPIKK